MILVRVLLIAIQAAFASAAVRIPQSMAGEYTFHVLANDAEEADTLASGRFVLSSTPLELSRLPADFVRDAMDKSMFLLSGGVRPNTCFGFERSPASVDGEEFYGGIIAAGLSQWREDGGQVRVPVYRSPDAAQFFVGRRVGDEIVGRVEQHNFDGTSHQAWLPFRARRVGPATVEACQGALELAAHHVRRHRDLDEAAGRRASQTKRR